MPTTIRDVAKRLNLSITTISRALDGYDDVSEKTRKLVIETAHEMGYTPNRAARQLRRQRTDTLGYILPSTHQGFSDPFFSEFIAGLGDEASTHNYDLLVTTAPPASDAEQALYQRWIQGGKVDGMVVNRVRFDDWRCAYLADHGVPFVSLERSSIQQDFVGIEADSYQGVAELMEYLINQGHSRIAYIGGAPELKIDSDRRSGYRNGLILAGITPDPGLVLQADLTPEGGYLAAGHLMTLAIPPTAVVCINDLTAIGAMRAIDENGYRVGRDIAVAGFDGIPDSAYTRPPLTTLDQPVYDIARRLVIMLLALVRGEPLPERQVRVQPKLLIRASTGV